MAKPSTSAPIEKWEVVGDRVRQRRFELRLNAGELGGVSASTVSSIETKKKTTYETRKLMDLARALGWTDDSIERLLAGAEPVEAEVFDEFHSLNGKRASDYTREQLLRMRALIDAELGPDD